MRDISPNAGRVTRECGISQDHASDDDDMKDIENPLRKRGS